MPALTMVSEVVTENRTQFAGSSVLGGILRKTNVVAALFIRPTIDGKRQWIEVNPKHDYPQGTIFILRWLPQGATNYKTKTR